MIARVNQSSRVSLLLRFIARNLFSREGGFVWYAAHTSAPAYHHFCVSWLEYYCPGAAISYDCSCASQLDRIIPCVCHSSYITDPRRRIRLKTRVYRYLRVS